MECLNFVYLYYLYLAYDIIIQSEFNILNHDLFSKTKIFYYNREIKTHLPMRRSYRQCIL